VLLYKLFFVESSLHQKIKVSLQLKQQISSAVVATNALVSASCPLEPRLPPISPFSPVAPVAQGSKKSPWIKWVADYAHKNNMDYFTALSHPEVSKFKQCLMH
jgi:hypothetical protein